MDKPRFIEQCEIEFEVASNGKPPNENPSETLDSLESATHKQTDRAYTFEEAVSLTECGKFHYQILLTGGLCFLTVLSQIICISLVLPAIQCDITATLKEQGMLASAGYFGVVVSSHTMGFLGDTWGRVRTLKLSLFFSTIAAVTSAFSTHIWMLIVTRFLTGVFCAGCQACVFSFCSEFHSSKTRARHVTLVYSFLSWGLVYLPLEAIFILPLHIDFTLFGIAMHPWRLLLLAVNISPIIGFILLFFTPETPKYDLIHAKDEKALNTLRLMFKRNTGRPVEEYPVQRVELETTGANIGDIHNLKDAVKMVWSQTIPVFYRERIFTTLNICLILFMTYGIPHGLFVWYPTILNEEINRDGDDLCQVISGIDILKAKESHYCAGEVNNLTNWLIVFVGGFMTVVYLFFAFTIDLFGKRNIVIFWLITSALCCIGVEFIANLPVAVLALTVINSAVNCGGIVGTIACEFYPTNINAMAMCFVMMIGRLGAVVGSNVFGQFLFNHCEWTFRTVAIIFFTIAIMSWLLPEKKPEKKVTN